MTTEKTFSEKLDTLSEILGYLEPLFAEMNLKPSPDYDHDYADGNVCDRCGTGRGDLTDCPGYWFEYNGQRDFISGEWR